MTSTANTKQLQAHSISFVATTNKVQPTEANPYSQARPLRDIISSSTTFSEALRPKKKTEDRMRGGDPSSPPKAVIIQSSESLTPVHTAGYGLVSAIMDAYNHHHNLILRPDDVWQAILTQFSFYVNANAEELRDCFVDFQGKKTLVINMPDGTLFSTDFASFATRMVDEQMTANLKDREVTTWLLPNFSTTKYEDRVAASVTLMSTLQAYFSYACCIMCGIPNVTLEGTPTDWRLLRQKIDRLPKYDVPGKDGVMKKWHNLLAPVLDQFVKSIEGSPDIKFWDTVCSHHGGGSGPSYLSGWVTVFSCFRVNGKWQGDVPDSTPRSFSRRGGGDKLTWPFIETDDIPVGTVSVPVLVDDNGTQYDTQMLAGQFAYEMTFEKGVHSGGKLDSLRPRTDWCIAYDGKPKANPKPYKQGEIVEKK